MLLQIITPEKLEWSGEVEKVSIPATGGQITVLPKHIDMITATNAGEAIVTQNDKQFSLFVSEGSAQIKNDEITLLVDIATQAKDLMESQMAEAKRAAEKSSENKQDTLQFAEIESNLKRELAKEKILQNYRKKTKQVGF